MASCQTSRSARRREALVGLASGLALALGALPAAAAPAFGPAFPLGGHAAGDARDDAPPAIAAGPNGTMIAVWDSTDTAGGAYGIDADVFFARSSDGGASWSTLAPLDPLAASDAAADREPAVATDGHGTWVAVWRSDRKIGTSNGDFDVVFARSLDDGLTWSPPDLLNPLLESDRAQDSQPAIAADGTGGWVVAWRAVATDSDVLFARSGDGGATWSAPAPLQPVTASSNGSDVTPAVASDGRGGWIVVWSSSRALGGALGADADLLFVLSSDGGVSWTGPGALNTNAARDGGQDTVPAVAADGAGGWLVAWQSSDPLGSTIGTDLDILAAHSADGGASWSAPAPVHAYAAGDRSQDSAPTLSCSAARRCVVAWSTNETLGGTIGLDLDIVLAATEDGGATWSAPAALDPRATLDAGADVEPALANDHRGGWVAVWQSNDSFGGTIGDDHDPLVAVGVEPPVCGDALLHRQEQCDDGNTSPGDGCRADCTAELCGDGILDAGEACDDGNAASGDGCDATCQAEAPPRTPRGPEALLAFFDAAVRDGRLVGTGRAGLARAHLLLLRWWLVLAVDWSDDARTRSFACSLLDLTLERVDGRRWPPDYATGPAAPQLAQLLEDTSEDMGCHRGCGRHGHDDDGGGGDLPR